MITKEKKTKKKTSQLELTDLKNNIKRNNYIYKKKLEYKKNKLMIFENNLCLYWF